MPDIDTDGGLWYQWYLHYIKTHQLVYDIANVAGYPLGYDISASPASNLVFSVQLFIMEHISGFSLKNLIFITNLSSLITYPLSAIGGYLLCYYFTRDKYSSFIAGLIFGFSFYHVYMGRGQMSINHIELIPFYFLSLFYFLDKKSSFSLILSALTFALLFMSDPYYAFFSGIFSVIFVLFYKKESFIEIIKTLFIYFIPVGIILILVNFNFVLSNLYLFDKVAAIQTGRNSLPRNELTNILYYFTPISVGVLNKLPFLGSFLYSLTFSIAILGAIMSNKNRMITLSLACFLLSIVLSAYIPNLFWINELYFRYFSMFRGVGRIALLGYLFLGL